MAPTHSKLGALERNSILERARERSHGKWIERILRQSRTTLTGGGLKEFKDIPDSIKNLPKLTGQASYPAWRIAVDKLISASKDGRQLIHLEKVLAYTSLSVPLGSAFDRLPRAEFDEATATREQIVQQAQFEQEFLTWDASKADTPHKLDSAPLDDLYDEEHGPEGAPDAAFMVRDQVEVRLYPPGSKDGAAVSGKAPRWVSSHINESDTNEPELRYVSAAPRTPISSRMP